MEPTATSNVVAGTLIASTTVALFTGVAGLVRQSPRAGQNALYAGLNTALTASSFFAVREYVVSPLLVKNVSQPQYARRRYELGLSSDIDLRMYKDEELPTLGMDIGTHKVLDTGISGALSGGVLRGLRSGARAILPGALTFSGGAILLQIAYNAIALRSQNQHTQHTPPKREQSIPMSRSFSDRFKFVVSDEDYLHRLRKERERHLARIQELEHKLSEEQDQGQRGK